MSEWVSEWVTLGKLVGVQGYLVSPVCTVFLYYSCGGAEYILPVVVVG